MTYGQQPDPSSSSNPAGGVPPVPPAPGAQQPGNAPAANPGGPSAPGGYGAPAGGPSTPPSYGQYGSGGAPAPWAGAGGPQPRPGTVTAGSVLAIIGGVFAIIFGFLFMGLGGNSELMSDAGLPAETASMLAGLGVVVLLVGILTLVFGIFALRGKFWAVIALTVLGGIYVLLAIASIAQGQASVLLGILWVGGSLALLYSGRSWYRSQS